MKDNQSANNSNSNNTLSSDTYKKQTYVKHLISEIYSENKNKALSFSKLKNLLIFNI